MTTVKDLIDSLSDCDIDSPIEVAISQYNKLYPIAYCKVDRVINKEDGSTTRLYVSLPDSMRTLVRKD